jgi:hypothetical protein
MPGLARHTLFITSELLHLLDGELDFDHVGVIVLVHGQRVVEVDLTVGVDDFVAIGLCPMTQCLVSLASWLAE